MCGLQDVPTPQSRRNLPPNSLQTLRLPNSTSLPFKVPKATPLTKLPDRNSLKPNLIKSNVLKLMLLRLKLLKQNVLKLSLPKLNLLKLQLLKLNVRTLNG